VGIDNFLQKAGTVVTDEHSFPLVNMKYSVSPVVRCAVSAKHPSDLLKLIDGLKRLGKSDCLVQITVEATGEHIIACAGELHLEICLNDLRDFMNGAELRVSPPVVPFLETVIDKSSIVCLSKSPNNHNRLFASAEPLHPDLVIALEKGEVTPRDEMKTMSKLFQDKYNWDATEARKIWAFGPEGKATNIVADLTKGVQYMNEIKEHVSTGFQYVTRKGVLADEGMRGIRFNILDCVLHTDSIHRGAGQMVPASQRCMYASQLTAKPRLLEPIYAVDIQCNNNCLSGVYNVLNQRRGVVLEAIPRIGTPLYTIKAYLPVTESFGFTEYLRSQTSGQAFPQLVFSHWEVVIDDPLLEGSRSAIVVQEIRKRKGIDLAIPPLDRFFDKM